MPSPPPPELAPFFLRFDWDERRLWELDLPVETIRTDALLWHLALPWWKGEGGWVASTGHRANIEYPGRYPEQYARTLNADLRWPLHVTLRDGRWTIMDGIHRLLKALMLELEHVQVRKVPASAYARIRSAA